MIENWVDFTLNVVAGATAFLCLSDGTRRLFAFGMHRKVLLMTVLAAGICVLYGAFAYWKYADLKATLSMNQRRAAAAQPANWSRLSLEKKEVLGLARARQTFMESGTLVSYIDRRAETRTFAPTQDDLTRRERVVTYYSRAEYSARSSLAEALLWLILALVAVLFGILMSLEKVPAPAGPTGELGDA
jgi:hypothetical protein